MKRYCLAFVMLASMAAFPAASAEGDKVFKIDNIQTTVPVGVTVMVKKITVGEDATVVNLVASFDSHQTNRVNLNDVNAYLAFGEDRKLHMRQPKDNRYLSINNGQSVEGDLVFPGRIPADAREVTLVFNEGNGGDDVSAPGITLAIPLMEAR